MFKFCTKKDFTGFSLIIPSVSVGNVAQLTVDLIIQNLKMEKIGQVYHPCIIPMVSAEGSFAFEKDTTTASELYMSETNKLLILQIRTPLTADLVQDFFDQIITFIKVEKISKLILFTSCFSYEQKIMIGMNLCEYMQNEKFKSENQVNLENDWNLREDENIFGKGFSLKLFKYATEQDVSCVNFLIYVNEGDNTRDSEIFLNKLNRYLQIFPRHLDSGTINHQLSLPQSWKFLFGNESNVDIY